MNPDDRNSSEKAVVLLSGGLDSATCLAIARDAGFDCHAISVFYGQRHRAELESAKHLVKSYSVREHQMININLDAFGGSALTDDHIPVPESVEGAGAQAGIPVTYVPARNTLFLSLALGYAESIGAYHIFIGVNAVDYSGYPDCRPEFIHAFEELATLATKAGVEGGGKFRIHTPLINMTKAEIIRAGMNLGVDYAATISCYQADSEGRACGRCDSCGLRRKGFEEAGVCDPTRYQ